MARARRSTTTGRFVKGGRSRARAGGTRRTKARASTRRGSRRSALGWLVV